MLKLLELQVVLLCHCAAIETCRTDPASYDGIRYPHPKHQTQTIERHYPACVSDILMFRPSAMSTYLGEVGVAGWWVRVGKGRGGAGCVTIVVGTCNLTTLNPEGLNPQTI